MRTPWLSPVLVAAVAVGMVAPVRADDPKPADPVKARAAKLKEASGFLEKAADYRAKGSRTIAESFFSQAELIVGPEGLADLAPLFREGAPPRVTTPLKQVPDAGQQPLAVGGSEVEDPPKKPERGRLTGQVTVGGKKSTGFGVVTLTPIGKKVKPRVGKPHVMEQRGREFLPHVMAVPVGSTVSFPNYDEIFHNVFSIGGSKAFDLGLYKGGQAREITFDKEGIVRVGCNIHANMSAYIVVVAAPHYALTDEGGHFNFGSLAPGKYRLRAWSEKGDKPLEQDVTIKAGDNAVEVGLGEGGEAPSVDKFGVQRGAKP